MGSFTPDIPLIYSYAIIISLWALITYLNYRLLSRRILPTLIIIVGSLAWWLSMAKSGLYYSYGIGFWGPHGHDAVWHLAVIEHFSHHLNLQNPIFAHTQLQNYHFGYDLLQAIIHRITQIPNHMLYFHILPPIIASGIGTTTYHLLQKLYPKLTPSAHALSVALVYFAGSAGWVVTLSRGQGLGGESMFWSQQAISTLVNPPFALSLILLNLILLFYLRHKPSPSVLSVLVISLLITLLAHTKIYAALLLLIPLGLLSLPEILQAVQNRHFQIDNFPHLTISFLSGIFMLFTLLPITQFSGSGFFNWQPYWFVQSMAASVDRFDWPRLEFARQAYSVENYPKYLIASFLGILIFYLGNLWTRILSLPYTLRLSHLRSILPTSSTGQRDLSHSVHFIITSIIMIGLIIPLFFTQSGTTWNTIQFMYYALYFLTLYLIPSLIKFAPKRWKILAILILLVNVPTTVGSLQMYLSPEPSSYIPYSEIQALNLLRQQPSGLVLSTPYRSSARENDQLLRNHTSSAYVAAYSQQPTFLEDQVNLEIIGVDWQPRRQEVDQFFQNPTSNQSFQWLANQQINYLYIINTNTQAFDSQFYTPIFQNSQVTIYQVRQS